MDYELNHFVIQRCNKTVYRTRTATCSCKIWKRAVHFYSPGVVRRSHAAVRHVRAVHCCTPSAGAAAAAAAADAGAAVYRQFDDKKDIIIN